MADADAGSMVPPDTYEITSWRRRGPLDALATLLGAFVWRFRGAVFYLVLIGLTIGWLRPHFDAILTLQGLLLTAAAVFPIATLMFVVWASDRTTTEPLGLVLRTFTLGVVLAVLGAMLNTQLSYLPEWLLIALVVGPGEEIFKLLGVYVLAYRHKAFDHAVDGIVYGVAAGAGFAAVENVVRVVAAAPDVVWQVVLVRTFVSTPAHVLWTAVAGFYLGLAKFIPEHSRALVAKGLIIAIAAHAIFDLLVTTRTVLGVAVAAALNLLLLAFIVYKARAYFRFYHRLATPMGGFEGPLVER